MSQVALSLGAGSHLRVPGYLSVKAAAQLLGMGERGVRHLIERRRMTSTRLGRMHFLSTRDVTAYRTLRRQRRLRATQRARRAA